ncbi:hypothetical protein VTN77DRAFT_3054 [Rasamsonia byssochlamydoides]|uniref:uncharacterized protein n=1 Tax=Rasamsonia byssochlamydoides TaxID=89139 RepID=UPI003743C3DF
MTRETNDDNFKTDREPFVALGDFGSPGDALASDGGYGTPDILKVIKIFKSSGITCCLAGISALIYYGAGRVRLNWETFVPAEKLEEASGILRSEPYNQIYEPYRPARVQLYSLHHTFPRLKLKGVNLRFLILPSWDCHSDCEPSQIERSKSGLPYPKLEVFAQSLLETQRKLT